jgi:integrase/recombinase XerD
MLTYAWIAYTFWERFMEKDLDIVEVKDVSQLHIKKYIQERQRVGKEVNRTIFKMMTWLEDIF